MSLVGGVWLPAPRKPAKDPGLLVDLMTRHRCFLAELMANVASFEPGFLREKDPRQCYSPTALRSAARVRSRATWETMQKLSRRYAIDLLPKVRLGAKR